MYNFTYHRATSLAEAESALAGADDGTLMAGGQTLLPTLKQRLASYSDVIDIGGIGELSGIEVAGGAVTVGATARHAYVASSGAVAGAIPALAHLASMIGDPQVRNMGTLGGSIANADPASDYPAAVVGLGATVNTNRRSIAGDDFFQALFETALEEGEIITSVAFPVPEAAGYAKFPQPASRFAMVGVFVSRGAGGIRVAVTGAGPCAFRVADMESALGGDFSPAAVEGISVPAAGLNSDIHGSAEYRAHLVTVMAKRAVAAAGG
jgi:carbon-monoxide dehydrogenase medium subunit